jgi:hypothetical protein
LGAPQEVPDHISRDNDIKEEEAADKAEKAKKGVKYGPHQEGPLKLNVANTFRGGSYTAKTLQSPTTVYRWYGNNSPRLGPYWTTTFPAGALQSQLDSAINPEWGNSFEGLATAEIPAGTEVFEGSAGPQDLIGGGSLMGGGNQIYIPQVDPSWILP